MILSPSDILQLQESLGIIAPMTRDPRLSDSEKGALVDVVGFMKDYLLNDHQRYTPGAEVKP